MSSLKPRRSAICRVPTAREKNETTTWNSTCSNQSWTSAPSTAHVASASIYSGNRSYILESWKQSLTLSERMRLTRYFLRLMEHFLTSSSMISFDLKLTRLSGHGAEITLRRELDSSLENTDSSDSSSKKLQKKNLKRGRITRTSK